MRTRQLSSWKAAFYVWLMLYVTTPFLVLATQLRNRRADPGTPDTGDLVFSRSFRYGLATVGVITIVVGTLLFLLPELMMMVWPWSLTDSLNTEARLSNTRIKQSGFAFNFPTADEGIPDVVAKWLVKQQSRPTDSPPQR